MSRRRVKGDNLGIRKDERVDWEELGMNLDVRISDDAGERLTSERMESGMSSGVCRAKVKLSSRTIDDIGSDSGRKLSMFPIGQFSADVMDSLFDEGDDEEVEDDDEGVVPDPADGRMMFSEAYVDEEGGHDVIFYPSDEGVDTKIIINRDGEKPIITIMRTGEFSNTLVLEEGRRHISVYGLSFMRMELAVYSKKVNVEFSRESGGVIEADYLVELRGLGIQRTRLRIEVEVTG